MEQQVQQVLTTIRGALSINQAERQAAESALQTWEADAAPGFVHSLIRIIEETAAVDEVCSQQLSVSRARCVPAASGRRTAPHFATPASPRPLRACCCMHACVLFECVTARSSRRPGAGFLAAGALLLATHRPNHPRHTNSTPPKTTTARLQPTRLLAAVIAKNTVGSSWRKTLGTREWSRVPAEEKSVVRESVLRLLLADPSDRWVAGGGGLGGRQSAPQSRQRPWWWGVFGFSPTLDTVVCPLQPRPKPPTHPPTQTFRCRIWQGERSDRAAAAQHLPV
jgi:hypothetical protein